MAKILFAGDFVASNVKNIQFSTELKDLISKCDSCCCNFEAPVEGDYGIPIKKSGPSLMQSKNSPRFLESAGFNIFSMANNHICDYGDLAVKNTLYSFSKSTTLGAGYFEEAYSYKIKEIGGYKIAFLSAAHDEFGTLKEQHNQKGVAWINHEQINQLIVKAKNEADYLIFIAHVGIEDIEIPLPEWRKRFEEIITLGADAIISTHTHCIQGWEFINQKPVFYSLGNFFFEMKSEFEEWNYGLVVILEINDKGISIDSVNILHKDQNKLNIDSTQDKKKYVDSLCTLLNSPNIEYNKRVDQIALALWDDVYKEYYGNALNRISLRNGLVSFLKGVFRLLFKNNTINEILLLNLIRCESHRWMVIRALELVYNNKQQNNTTNV